MSIIIRRPKEYDCFDKGIPIDKLSKPTDVTWIYGSTEEARQNYINSLIDENMREYVSHVYRITKSSNIKEEFAEAETKILVVHNLKNANIGEQDICRMIDGSSLVWVTMLGIMFTFFQRKFIFHRIKLQNKFMQDHSIKKE